MKMGEINAIKEFCDKMRIPEPEYVFPSDNSPLSKFQCKVTLGNCCGEGEGDNKKEAKRNAARSLYKMLEIKIGSAPQLVIQSQPFTDYVSQVNLLCQKEGCTLPTFQLIAHQGQTPNEMFTMQCKVRNFVSVGNGFNKKSAKQSSAKEMLDILKSHIKAGHFLNA